MKLFRCKYRWISSKETSSANQSALWLQVPSSQSFNLFFSTTALAISYATFKRHCTYPEDFQPGPRSDVKSNQSLTGIFQETTNENRAARYSMPQFIRTMKDCFMKILVVMLNFQRWHLRFNWWQTYNYENNHDKIYLHT